MEAPRFALTKIQPPRLRLQRVVQRASLGAALVDALLTRRVVLLQAPAGFGKTTLLAQHRPRLPAGTALAWIALDEDDDAQRIFACMVAALEPHDLPWRTSPDALVALAAEDAGSRRAVAELHNALGGADSAHGVIVFDDLHRVRAPRALALIDALIERLPPQWTVVLSTRLPPAGSLARWRAGGELAEFDQTSLRFSADEAAALVAAEPSPPLRERIGDLVARTQGWPAGLQLCIEALRTRLGTSGTLLASGSRLLDRHLFDYLASEVLDDMPAPLCDFLTRCSVLPELTAARAAAVSGDAHAARWLDETERRGLFVTVLDAQERTLVLHDLFRHALDERLQRLHPDELPGLLRRAAAGESDSIRRVGFLLRANDWQGAEHALDAAAPDLLLHSQAGEVQHLVDTFPAAWRAKSARLLRLGSFTHWLRWQWDDMANCLEGAVAAALAAGDEAEARLAQAWLTQACYPLGRTDRIAELLAELRPLPLPDQARAISLMGECMLHYRCGDLDRIPATYAEIVILLERGAPLFTWWVCAPALNWSTLQGIRPVLQRYLGGALERIGERPLPMRAEVQIHRAWIALWAGEFDTAMELAGSAAADLKWLACSGEMEGSLRLFEMLADAIRGRSEAVWRRLDEFFEREDHGTDEWRELWRRQVGVFGLRLNDVLGGDPGQVRRWAGQLAERPLQTDTDSARADLARARYAAAEGRWSDAAALFVKLLPLASRMDVMGQAIEIQLRAAHALLRDGRLAQAAEVLAPALESMRAEGERGHALMCGAEVLSTLARAHWGAWLGNQTLAELRAAAALASALREGETGPMPGAPPHPVLANGDDGLLSTREREVLALIAAGDSNKVIARALDISPHTVKRHVANILDKLGLASRGQAGAWLRANGHPKAPA
ncbi:MAG TPA: LuxR C-terminal-related transcriptional regulator [Albitalea sp.]|uniref:LuxR C-terminal-related transcriptional regulator n=1 Tax=Piscinibacter sp. TaxID=1903157 RepID=UPI002ED2C7D3